MFGIKGLIHPGNISCWIELCYRLIWEIESLLIGRKEASPFSVIHIKPLDSFLDHGLFGLPSGESPWPSNLALDLFW